MASDETSIQRPEQRGMMPSRAGVAENSKREASLVNWPFLVALLTRHGHSMRAIASEIGIPADTISRLGLGAQKDIKFHDGVRLLDYANDHLPGHEFARLREDKNR